MKWSHWSSNFQVFKYLTKGLTLDKINRFDGIQYIRTVRWGGGGRKMDPVLDNKPQRINISNRMHSTPQRLPNMCLTQPLPLLCQTVRWGGGGGRWTLYLTISPLKSVHFDPSVLYWRYSITSGNNKDKVVLISKNPNLSILFFPRTVDFINGDGNRDSLMKQVCMYSTVSARFLQGFYLMSSKTDDYIIIWRKKLIK